MQIEKQEVLRYLSYKNQNIHSSLDLLIDESILEIKEYLNLRNTFKIFNIERNTNNIKLLNSNILFKGHDIAEHLKNSDVCAILALTIGNIVERKIKYYQKTNLTKAVILDACATVAVESYADEVQKKIEEEAAKLNLGITYRYSPGYGDFNIGIQPFFIKVLEADKKIGLSVTEDNILLPRKSITAVIGFQDKKIVSTHPGCNSCNTREMCKFRKEGNYCGK